MSTSSLASAIARVEIPLSLLIIICYVFASFAIHQYKKKHGKSPWVHESSVAALLGVVIGGVIKFVYGVSIRFNSNLFFFLVLPPVIFSAGSSHTHSNYATSTASVQPLNYYMSSNRIYPKEEKILSIYAFDIIIRRLWDYTEFHSACCCGI